MASFLGIEAGDTPQRAYELEGMVMGDAALPEFYQILLDQESNIDSNNVDWYVANLEKDVVDYWAVERPGRLRRSPANGAPIKERITVSECLRRTGVLDLFLRRDIVGIRAVQFAVVNPWGFVGYQFGEQLLIDLQYYRPSAINAIFEGDSVKLDRCYSNTVPEYTWRNGLTACIHREPSSGILRVATDVNTWEGTFTGRDGVWSFDDLRRPDCQVAILRASLRHNSEILSRLLGGQIHNLWDPRTEGLSAASLLAASHLCGPFAVAEHVVGGTSPVDEAGTSIAEYIQKFAEVSLAQGDVYQEDR